MDAKRLIIFILLTLAANIASAKDWILDGTTSVSRTLTTAGLPSNTGLQISNIGVSGNEYDGNTSTYYGKTVYMPYASGASSSINLTETFTLSSPISLTSVYFKASVYGGGGGMGGGGGSASLSLTLLDSSNNVIATLYSQSGGGASVSYSPNTTYSGSWSNVKVIKVTGSGIGSGSTSGGGGGSIFFYEIQAIGPELAYLDKKLYYYSQSGVKTTLALEVLNNHKFRFVASDGVTYGIPLVDTASTSASTVRVYDGSAIKAWAKVS